MTCIQASIAGTEDEVASAENASVVIEESIDETIAALNQALRVAHEAKSTIVKAKKDLDDMNKVKRAEALDTSQYSIEAMARIADGIDFCNATLATVRDKSKFHSFEEIEKVEDKDIFIKFLAVASKNGFANNTEFRYNMQALKNNGVFHRENFSIPESSIPASTTS